MAGNVRAMKMRKGDPELIFALASGATQKAAAAHAGVSEKTVFRRMQEPAFRSLVANARTELISRSVGLLAASGTEAALTLRNLLNARAEHVRLGAAKSILELVPRLRESEELAARIANLEQALEQMPTNGVRQWRA